MSALYRKVILIFFLLLLIMFLCLFYTRGFMLHDEGYILHAAQRILDGEIPYKDFDIVYTPGAPFVTAFFFKLFGEKIIVARLGSLVFVLGSVIVLYRLFALFSKRIIIRLLPVAVYISWLPIHLNFSWPAVYAVFFGITTFYFLALGRKEKRKSYYFLAGISTVATVLFKQNFGLATFITVLTSFMLDRSIRTITFIVSFLKGIGITSFFFLFYLVSTSSLYPFIYASYYYLIQKISIEGVVNTPFIYHDQLITMMLRTAFYLVPFIMPIIGIVISFKYKKELVFLHVFVLLFYLFGIRPITDFIHLIPLLALSGISLTSLLIGIKNKLLRIGLYLFSVLLISIGIYTAVFRGYYRWESPIMYHNRYLNNRIGIFVDEKYFYQVSQLKSYVSLQTNPDDYIYVNYYYPSLYFILNRKNPTRFIYLSSDVIDHKNGNEIIESLKAKNVKLVLTHSAFNNSQTNVFQFIQKHYPKKKQIGDFIAWTR